MSLLAPRHLDYYKHSLFSPFPGFGLGLGLGLGSGTGRGRGRGLGPGRTSKGKKCIFTYICFTKTM